MAAAALALMRGPRTARVAGALRRSPSLGIAPIRPAAGPVGALLRWWRVGSDHLWRLAMSPVRETLTPMHRYADVLELYGLRIDRAGGPLRGYYLVPARHGLRRQAMPRSEVSLAGSPGGTRWLALLIERHDARWCELAGLHGGDEAARRRRGAALGAALQRRWGLDGTVERLRRIVARAFALDPRIVELAAASSPRGSSPACADTDDYNRARVDEDNLLSMQRELPALLRLYAALLPRGSGDDEPKQALRRAVLAIPGLRPRMWRQLCRFDAGTLGWLERQGSYESTHPLEDLLLLLRRLDVPRPLPQPWLEVLMNCWGLGTVSPMAASAAQVGMLRAHLTQWLQSSEADHDALAAELVLVNDHVCTEEPPGPPGSRHWTWWLRKAKQWDASVRAEAVRLDREAGRDAPQVAGPSGQGLVALRLRTAVALLDEGRAMAHCIFSWHQRVARGEVAAYSVRQAGTLRRVATVAVTGGPVSSLLARGFANRELPGEVEAAVRRMLATVHPGLDAGALPDGPS